MRLLPEKDIGPEALAGGQRVLVADAAWASLTGALSGGVVLVALALELGAGPQAIGLLGAIPFIAQAAQLPAIAVVDHVRRRKLIGVLALGIARLLILALALLPFLPAGDQRLTALIVMQAMIASLGSFAACAVNSWFHQLLPASELGSFFGRRLMWATGMACAGTLAVGLLVEQAPWDDRVLSYALALAGAGVAGALSTWYLARCPEPVMEDTGPRLPLLQQLRQPFADRGFRALLLMLGSWNLASNLVAPFLTVFLMQQLGYGLSTVTALWVSSQVANGATLLAWGRVSDRLSNKAILAVAVPMYFACTIGLVFVPGGPPHTLQLALLFGLHIVMGAAGGGIGLATGNLGLKLAPRGRGTAYLAAIGIVGSVTGGIAPLAGGALAQWFSERNLWLVVRWLAPGHTGEVSVLSFAHWEFLFAISALLGLYVLHAVSRLGEGSEISERRVIQELGLEALRTLNQLSSIGGMLGNLFAFERTAERRRTPRPPRT